MENNFAFIDSQNLNLSIKSLGWQLDLRRFRVYLEKRYSVSKAYLFLGYIEEYKDMYSMFKDFGYEIIFKPVVKGDNSIKGNVDAELVLQSMIDFYYYNKAIVVSGDGDFYCLVNYLISKDKLKKILVPNHLSYSSLLSKFPSEFLAFVSYLKKKVEYKKEKNPASKDLPGASHND